MTRFAALHMLRRLLRGGLFSSLLRLEPTNNHVYRSTTMPAAGPQLPPHLLAKRKRQAEETPETNTTASSGASPSRSPTDESKRQRVLGPAPPPAPLDERPTQPAAPSDEDGSSSDDDDDFGPALPSAFSNQDAIAAQAKPIPSTTPAPVKSQRDEWMMVPPKQDDLAARTDPSKVRARGFNTGKAARPAAAAGGMDTAWTETPEEKLKRLQREAMGVESKHMPGSAGFDAKAYEKNKEKEERARRIREHTVSVVFSGKGRIDGADLLCRKRHEVRRCWISIRRRNQRRRRMIRVNGLLTGRKTWVMVEDLAIQRGRRC